MSTVVLCRNFSSGTFASRSLRTREIRNEPTDGAGSGASERVERAERSGVATGRFEFQSRPVEFETQIK
jgi:hypothetical protein